MVKKIMYLNSIEQVRALMEPSRQRIIRELSAGATTSKEIAKALGQSVPRVHYHLKELEAQGLIRTTKKVQKGNLIESHYEAAAKSFRSSTSLEAEIKESASGLQETLTRGLLVALDSLENRVVEVVNLIEEADPESFTEIIKPSLLESGLNADLRNLYLTQAEYDCFLAEYKTLVGRYKKNRKKAGRKSVEIFWMSLPDPEAIKSGPL